MQTNVLSEILLLILVGAAIVISLLFCWLGWRLLVAFTLLGRESIERLLSIESRLAGIESALERLVRSREQEQRQSKESR